MLTLPEGYAITSVSHEDIAALIVIDKAASALFVPTGLIRPEMLDDHVPPDAFEAAIISDHVFAARDADGRPVGFILTSQRGNSLYLDQVSVHPEHGRKGLGTALVIRILREAEDRRLPDVILSTFRDLPWNGPFYISLGFRELPRSKLEPYMLEIEDAQRPHMDVSARCFMRRKVRRPLLRFKRSP